MPTGQSKAMQVTQPGGQVSLNSIIPKNINFTSVEEMLKAAQFKVKNAAQQSNAIISQKRRRNAIKFNCNNCTKKKSETIQCDTVEDMQLKARLPGPASCPVGPVSLLP